MHPYLIVAGRGAIHCARSAIGHFLLLLIFTTACDQAERLADIAPRVVLPGPGPRLQAAPAQQPGSVEITLPPEQKPQSFDWAPMESDAAGNRRFLARIRLGGSPSLIALEKLTPLFNVDGKGPVEYVSEAFFAANPNRTPRSIQPGDEMVLTVPADTFVVRWQEEREEDLFGRVRIREYVSDRGDRLRMYLTDRFPIAYELESVEQPGVAQLRFSPDLAYLLGSRRLDPLGLARLIYRVPSPDLIQMQQVRQLVARVEPGKTADMSVDRTKSYLDPVRQAMSKSLIVERVPNPGMSHLIRAAFPIEGSAPFLAVEDALGEQPDISQLSAGKVFRIIYGRDGVVQVSYLTGDDDERGRRDPYQLRENERWADIYHQYIDGDAAPVAWGPGEPSDIAPFPTARDPNRRTQDGERSYDYLVANRAILLTFRPLRTRSDTRTEAELGEVMRQLGKQYHSFTIELDGWFPEFRR